MNGYFSEVTVFFLCFSKPFLVLWQWLGLLPFLSHSFVSSLTSLRYLSSFSLFFNYIKVTWKSEIQSFQWSWTGLYVVFLLACYYQVQVFVLIWKSQEKFHKFHSLECILHWTMCFKYRHLHSSRWVTFPAQSCIFVYFLYFIFFVFNLFYYYNYSKNVQRV